jgi:murein DD-endopeptidase MepM/ murein hydrolase activator NlpD
VRVRANDYPVQKLQLPRSMVELSSEDQARVARENREIARLWGRTGERRFRLPLQAPLDPLPSGGRFGARRIINGLMRSPHGGADYGAPAATPVVAAADGEVALVADHFFGGRSVFLDHGDGLITMYFHLSRSDVTTGQEVRQGERIGAVGDTGRAKGPHLHFGIRWHRARVDPALLLGDPETIPAIPEPQ